jgi:phosphatidate cytidylyltransferase
MPSDAKAPQSPTTPATSSSRSSTTAQPAPAAAPPARSSSDALVRIVTTLMMAYGFLAIVSRGASLTLPIVLFVMVLIFREVVRINQKERKDRQMPYFQFLPWYFLTVTVFAVVAIALRPQLIATYPDVAPLYSKLYLTLFGFTMIGFVAFVLSLRRGLYRYQFGQFTWMAMTLLFIVVQGSLHCHNMLRGMFWFLLPVSCVVHNDVWAYACGKLFGATPLLRLSPKKTLEGFAGAFLMTVVWAWWFAGFMCRFETLVCPKVDLHSDIRCQIVPLFVHVPVAVPALLQSLAGGLAPATVLVAPVQWHAIVVATFASLIAPFGGFFASGLKRAFKLKDFGDLIPGHGGMTDRMDCQIIMGCFTYIYAQFLLSTAADGGCPVLPELIDCVRALPLAAQQQLIRELGIVSP